jgi:hypothetical protein
MRVDIVLLPIMVATLKKVDLTLVNAVDQSVFLRNAPGPSAERFERFRLPYTFKGVRLNRFNQFQDFARNLLVDSGPVLKILLEMLIGDQLKRCLGGH